MFQRGSTLRSYLRLLLLCAGVVLFSTLLSPAIPLTHADEVQPRAQILSLIVRNQVVESTQLVTVRRAPNGCPEVTEVRKGLPLCVGDWVKTSAEVQVRIAFGDPRDGNEVTLNQNSEITVSSISCGVCGWFASLHNYFTNRVQHVSLSNRGTVYEVIPGDDESVQLIVYQGEVEIAKADGPEPGPGAGESPPLVKVPGLFKVIIDRDGTPGEKESMTQPDLCMKLASSTATEISVHETPPEVGGNVAKFINFPNSSRRNDTFGTARCSSFWEPTQPINFETLGYVYNDWSDATKALAMFAKASSLYTQQLQNWTPRDELRINKAIAYRQLGQTKEALDELEPVLAKSNSPLTGDALNVRGTVYYDLARQELIRNQTPDWATKARELLAKASADYDQALAQARNQRQYIQVNRGQVLKVEGDIAQREGDSRPREEATQRQADYQRAEGQYIEAIKALMAAYGQVGTDNPQNKIASLSVARARAALANTYAAMGKPEQSEEFYNRAEETYRAAIQDADKEKQNFAAPYCGLASLYLILGKPETADNYAKCTAFNIAALVADVTVPNVVNLRRATAIHVLAEAGLEPDITVDGEAVESQEPAAASVVKIGTKIKLKLIIQGRS